MKKIKFNQRNELIVRTVMRLHLAIVCAVSAVVILINNSCFAANSASLATVYSFNGPSGSWPTTLAQGADSNFYGITLEGGAADSNCVAGCGTVFSITATGAEAVLHQFDATYGAPAGIVQGSNGLYYGATTDSLFSLTDGGNFQVLQALTSSSPGEQPFPPIQGIDGNYYTVSSDGVGGDYSVCLAGCGAVFSFTQDGLIKNLYEFSGGIDGGGPSGSLIQVADGSLYGVTAYGGNFQLSASGKGTIFKITSSGEFKTVYTFSGRDGAMPAGSLVKSADGSLYGVTLRGGKGFGTVYKLASDGALTVLHEFNIRDGSRPYRLIMGSDGVLYGIANTGGVHGSGVLFEVTTSGQFTVLSNFTRRAGGLYPFDILQSADGNLYGVSAEGGDYNLGTVWRYSLAK